MAIGKDKVFGVLDKMRTEKQNISVDSLQQMLKEEYNSGGNRNKVNDLFNEWCDLHGVARGSKQCRISAATAKKVLASTKTATAPKTCDTDQTIINKLPEPLRNPLITLINAICTLIGLVRTQEREAATVLVEHARVKQAEALAEAKQRIVELEASHKQLNAENAELKAALSARQQSVLAEQLVEGIVALLKSGSLESIISANQPKEPAIKATLEPPEAVSAEASKEAVKAKVVTKIASKIAPVTAAKKSSKNAGRKKAA